MQAVFNQFDVKSVYQSLLDRRKVWLQSKELLVIASTRTKFEISKSLKGTVEMVFACISIYILVFLIHLIFKYFLNICPILCPC